MRNIGPVALLTLTLAVPASAFTVQGTITDSAGNPIPGIKVSVFDDEAGADLLLATAYTDAAGSYSAVINGGWGAGNPDPYVNVEWKWRLDSPAPNHGGAHLHLLKKLHYNTVSETYMPFPNYTPKAGAATPNHDPTMDLTLDLTMDQAVDPPSAGGLDDLPALARHVKEALDFHELNKGGVAWSWNQDVRLFLLGNTHSSFILSKAPWHGFAVPLLCIGVRDINGTGAGGARGWVSDIYHETGHYVHHVFHGNALPPTTFSGQHSANTESDPGWALTEGWSSYVADLTDQQHGMDGKFIEFRDEGGTFAPRSLWRGNEVNRSVVPAAWAPTGRDPGPPDKFESGDIVEGALSGVWFGIHEDPLFAGFETNFKVMVDDRPDDIAQFRAGLIGDLGADTPEAVRAYEIFNEHGIVYSRARFALDPFMLPQSTAAGTAIEIADKVHLRGSVAVTFESLQQDDLGLATAPVALERVRLRWNTASDDLTNRPEHFLAGNETPWEDFGLGTLTFDTVTLGLADGDYDLLLQGENEHGAPDNFFPTWGPNPGTAPPDPGDANPSVDLDETYLKVIGGWFDTDRDPITNTAIGGKIVIDNTAPVVTIFKTP